MANESFSGGTASAVVVSTGGARCSSTKGGEPDCPNPADFVDAAGLLWCASCALRVAFINGAQAVLDDREEEPMCEGLLLVLQQADIGLRPLPKPATITVPPIRFEDIAAAGEKARLVADIIDESAARGPIAPIRLPDP